MWIVRDRLAIDPLFCYGFSVMAMRSQVRMAQMMLNGAVMLFLISGCAMFGGKDVSEGGVDYAAVDEAVFDPDLTRVAYDPTIIMKRAEGFFERQEFAEAVVEYQHFLDLHKTHRLTPYALYKLSLSYVNQIQTVDRDPDPLRKGREALQILLRDFPGSRYEADARALYETCYELMAEQEVYVGRFYYRTGGYIAALHRLENVVREYPDASEATADALYYLALTYRKIDDTNRALKYTQQLVAEHPESERHREMTVMLVELQDELLPPEHPPATRVASDSPDWLGSLRSMLIPFAR